LFIEDLSRNEGNLYVKFSNQHDLDNVITVFILDHAKDFCTFTGNSISCSRTGGFSFILSTLANNIVLSKFDLEDPKIIAHEMGHFFGLYHLRKIAILLEIAYVIHPLIPELCLKLTSIIPLVK